MKISFDLDGTLLKYPELMSSMASNFKSWGHEVGILSGHTPENLQTFLQGGWDFVIGCPLGAPYDSDEQKAKEWKSKMIRENKIDIHFDNHADFILEGDVGNAKVVKCI